MKNGLLCNLSIVNIMEANTVPENINVEAELEQNEDIFRNSVNTEIDSVEESINIENDNVDNDHEEGVDDEEELDTKKPTDDASNKVVRLTRLPVARIKSIMKFDENLNAASQEAVFIITKATELFIEELSKETYQFTIANKKKTIQKKDVEDAFRSQDYFIFLDGCFNE